MGASVRWSLVVEKSSFSVKSRDLGAKGSLKSCIIFISRTGELMMGGDG